MLHKISVKRRCIVRASLKTDGPKRTGSSAFLLNDLIGHNLKLPNTQFWQEGSLAFEALGNKKLFIQPIHLNESRAGTALNLEKWCSCA
jgi:hypothetical protein